ncbi:unnamed protein product [Arabidopsis lyrata]|uniref:Predicted protein n=1 Tax=Arabidopsis lyrata subsp. lyrata TaxID=81972 RepID=D7KE81_ARALL|nr:predicted protein [Arabidopsis lyrata subsp. lyrata]CAH8251180.1 unnamed protein product [Arabidopsis lyrata]
MGRIKVSPRGRRVVVELPNANILPTLILSASTPPPRNLWTIDCGKCVFFAKINKLGACGAFSTDQNATGLCLTNYKINLVGPFLSEPISVLFLVKYLLAL